MKVFARFQLISLYGAKRSNLIGSGELRSNITSATHRTAGFPALFLKALFTVNNFDCSGQKGEEVKVTPQVRGPRTLHKSFH